MATTSQDLKIRYVGDAAALKRTLGGIDKMHASFADKLKAVGGKISSVGSSMTRTFTLPIAAGFAVGINEATEFAQVHAQTAAAIKSTGGAAGLTGKQIADLSARIGQLSAQDGEAVQAGENILLTFTNIRNELGKGNAIFDRASLAAANLSARMGTDLKGSMVLVGKALNDPVKGLSALTRVGVSFTEKQKKQIAAMVKSGDVMGAQKAILAELGKEFGGSAKAAGDAASPFTKLKLAGLDIAQSMGKVLLPIVGSISRAFAGFAKWLQALSPGARKVVLIILAVVAAIGPLLIVIGKLVSAIGTISKAFTFLAANPAVLIWVLIAAAVIALTVVIVKNWSTIKAFLLKVWGALKAAWEKVWGAIKAVGIAVWNALKAPVVAYFNFYKAIWGGILDVAKVVWDKVKGVWNGAKDFFRGLFDTIKSIATGAWGAIVGALKTVWNAIARTWNATVGKLSISIPSWVPLVGGHGFDMPDLPTLAAGGQIRRAGAAIVGELGPELVRLPRGALVQPLQPARIANRVDVHLRPRLEITTRALARGRELHIVTAGW